MAIPKRYQVLQAIVSVLNTHLMPRPPMVRIGYMNYQSVHQHPAVFVTIGPGSTTVRQQHTSWEHRFVVRIAWLAKGTTSTPLELSGLQIHDQLLDAFDLDHTLGGLCRDIAMVNDFGSDEGELALLGQEIGPFWQDFVVRMVHPVPAKTS